MEKEVTLKCSNCGQTFDQNAKALGPVFCPVCGADRVTYQIVEKEGGREEAKPLKSRKK